MDREQEILNLIEKKKKLIEDTKNELYSLDFELHEIEKKKVLKKYKIGDIIVHRNKYLFRLDEIQVCGGYAASKQLILTNLDKASKYDTPQPMCRLWTLLEFGRHANKKEIEYFKKEFGNE